MSQAPRQSRGRHPIRDSRRRLSDERLDAHAPRPGRAEIRRNHLVWAHWFVVAFSFVQLAYRPAGWPERYVMYAPLFLLLVAFNGYTHYRLATNKTITWRWILGLAAMDVTMVSVATAIGGGFSHYFLHLLYYPLLAGYALVFTSFRLTMVCVTVVSAMYLAISLTVGEGIDMGAREEKPLLARIFVMYAVAATVNLISSFERSRWRAAVERERELQRERIELSQAIHDTAAQTAFMIGLGIDAAKQVAGDSNEELTARLDATSRLSKTAVWQLRHPIDMGRIFEGSELGWTLDSHVATFRTITSVSAELTQNGVEPPLSVDVRSLLFTIAHNALANAFRQAGRAGCWSSSTSDGMSSGSRCRTTGWGFPTTTRGGATASKTCGRTPCVWADAYRRTQGFGRGRERDLRDAVGSRRTGGIGCQQSLVA